MGAYVTLQIRRPDMFQRIVNGWIDGRSTSGDRSEVRDVG